MLHSSNPRNSIPPPLILHYIWSSLLAPSRRTSISKNSFNKFRLPHTTLWTIVSPEYPLWPLILDSLKHQFLSFYQGRPLSGHMGFYKVLHKVRLHCYWPKMRHDITHCICTYPTCQGIKTQLKQVNMPCPGAVTQPFKLVGWDLIGPFPTWTQGNKYILVITEYLARWCEAKTLPNTSTISNALICKIILPHGCPI
jgi:hypothetical protein